MNLILDFERKNQIQREKVVERAFWTEEMGSGHTDGNASRILMEGSFM